MLDDYLFMSNCLLFLLLLVNAPVPNCGHCLIPVEVTTMSQIAWSLWNDEKGAGAIDAGLMLALVSAFLIGALGLFGESLIAAYGIR